jgi:hypothetical protein
VTLQERCDAFAAAYGKWPAARPHVVREDDREVIYATWVIGNDYRNKTPYYGAFPAGFLDRLMALYPDHPQRSGEYSVLHAFSGSLPKGNYLRCDSVRDAEFRVSVYDLPEHTLMRFGLIIADPPYSAQDAEKYGTAGVNRRKATAALGQVARRGAHMAWLDTCWPMHNKRQWVTVGRILVQRSTNHRARVLTLFEKVSEP